MVLNFQPPLITLLVRIGLFQGDRLERGFEVVNGTMKQTNLWGLGSSCQGGVWKPSLFICKAPVGSHGSLRDPGDSNNLALGCITSRQTNKKNIKLFGRMEHRKPPSPTTSLLHPAPLCLSPAPHFPQLWRSILQGT